MRRALVIEIKKKTFKCFYALKGVSNFFKYRVDLKFVKTLNLSKLNDFILVLLVFSYLVDWVLDCFIKSFIFPQYFIKRSTFKVKYFCFIIFGLASFVKKLETCKI